MHRRTGSLDARTSDDLLQKSPSIEHYKQLITDLRSQGFDQIRFSTYRTACKLRFMQKRMHLHLVDIWNVIEAIRENGMHTVENRSEINVSRVESLLSSLFYTLNKRLPLAQQVSVEICSGLLLNWLMSAYDSDEVGRIRVSSVKIALAVMCNGKLMDKLRYIFSQLSDTQGHLVTHKFLVFMKEVLALPASVCESPSFGYNESSCLSIFDTQKPVTLNDFLDALMSDPGPQMLVWLPILHRMSSVENVLHPIVCNGCKRDGFMGFRYKCQRCPSYHLCQECFWKGRFNPPHSLDHDMKEFATYRTGGRPFSHSLRRSLRCIPSKMRDEAEIIPRFPDQPEPTLNLSHIIPPSPLPMHNGFHDDFSPPAEFERHATLPRRGGKYSTLDSMSSGRIAVGADDEHRLIARYAARLAADANNEVRSPSEISLVADTSRQQRELIMQLEAKNREIMSEIARLRHQQELEDQASMSHMSPHNPMLLAELRALRQRKEELEGQLGSLQDSRRELMLQLESLMKLLKTHHTGSSRSTPNGSPHSSNESGPPATRQEPQYSPTYTQPRGEHQYPHGNGSLQKGMGGPFGSGVGGRSDLLIAADNVSNAMSSLVRELHSSPDDGGGYERERQAVMDGRSADAV